MSDMTTIPLFFYPFNTLVVQMMTMKNSIKCYQYCYILILMIIIHVSSSIQYNQGLRRRSQVVGNQPTLWGICSQH